LFCGNTGGNCSLPEEPPPAAGIGHLRKSKDPSFRNTPGPASAGLSFWNQSTHPELLCRRGTSERKDRSSPARRRAGLFSTWGAQTNDNRHKPVAIPHCLRADGGTLCQCDRTSWLVADDLCPRWCMAGHNQKSPLPAAPTALAAKGLGADRQNATLGA
jgi:hypothetical protein